MAKQQTKENKKWNALALIAITTMWIPFAGLVLGVAAMIQISKTKEKGLWLAILAIVLPFITFVLMVGSIVFLVKHTNNRTNDKAAKLGITSNEYRRLKKAIDGNCELEAIQTGNYYSEGFYTKSFTIDNVDDGFAVGTRTCKKSDTSETFIANQDNIYNKDSTWRFIYVNKNQPSCELLDAYGVPESLIDNCVESGGSRQPVRALQGV